jgi:hypothetical protein
MATPENCNEEYVKFNHLKNILIPFLMLREGDVDLNDRIFDDIVFFCSLIVISNYCEYMCYEGKMTY